MQRQAQHPPGKGIGDRGAQPADGRIGPEPFEGVQRPVSVSFGIWIYRFESGPVSLNPDHNEFSFVINADQITQLRFNDERLTIDDDLLVLRYWGDEHPMLYARE